MNAVIEEVDCTRFSADRDNPECDARGEAALGVLTIIGVLALVIGYVVWRRVMRKYEASHQSTASQTDAKQEAVLQQLREDYEANLEAHDADTLEASRDWHDNDGSSWRVEAGLALGILVLFASLLVLIPLFLLFKALAQ